MDNAEDGFGFTVPPPFTPPLNLSSPMQLNKHSFSLGSKRIMSGDELNRGGPASAGGAFAHLIGSLEDDYFDDEMMEDDEFEDDEIILGNEEDEDSAMSELQNPMVHVSEH